MGQTPPPYSFFTRWIKEWDHWGKKRLLVKLI